MMHDEEFWSEADKAREEAAGSALFEFAEALYTVTIYGVGDPIYTTAHVYTLDAGHDGVLGDVVAEIVSDLTGNPNLVGVGFGGWGSVVDADVAFEHGLEAAAQHAIAWFDTSFLDLDQVQGFVDSHW